MSSRGLIIITQYYHHQEVRGADLIIWGVASENNLPNIARSRAPIHRAKAQTTLCVRKLPPNTFACVSSFFQASSICVNVCSQQLVHT